MCTLTRASINVTDRQMEFDDFITTLNLFIGVKEIKLGWYKHVIVLEHHSFVKKVYKKILTPLMISQFTNLTKLNLVMAKINQADVVYFENLTKLTDLCLDKCDFTENSEQGLSILTQLTTLNISEPKYIVVTECASEEYLTCLTQLRELTLGGEVESGDIKELRYIGTLTGLSKLSLLKNEALTDQNIINLSMLSNLSELYLESCRNITISGIASLTSLEQLESLGIDYVDSWFSHAEGTSLEPLTNFTGLKSLTLWGHEVDNRSEDENLNSPGIHNKALEDIARMTNLTSLSLNASPADFNCLESLSRLTQLEFLALEVRNNSEDMADNFLKMCPDSVKTLKQLYVNNKILRGLYAHPNLTCLDLVDCLDEFGNELINRIPLSYFDQFISATTNLVSITGFYGPKELAERREILRTKSEGNVATLS